MVSKLSRRVRVAILCTSATGLSLALLGCGDGKASGPNPIPQTQMMDYDKMMKSGGMKPSGGATNDPNAMLKSGGMAPK